MNKPQFNMVKPTEFFTETKIHRVAIYDGNPTVGDIIKLSKFFEEKVDNQSISLGVKTHLVVEGLFIVVKWFEKIRNPNYDKLIAEYNILLVAYQKEMKEYKKWLAKSQRNSKEQRLECEIKNLDSTLQAKLKELDELRNAAKS